MFYTFFFSAGAPASLYRARQDWLQSVTGSSVWVGNGPLRRTSKTWWPNANICQHNALPLQPNVNETCVSQLLSHLWQAMYGNLYAYYFQQSAKWAGIFYENWNIPPDLLWNMDHAHGCRVLRGAMFNLSKNVRKEFIEAFVMGSDPFRCQSRWQLRSGIY